MSLVLVLYEHIQVVNIVKAELVLNDQKTFSIFAKNLIYQSLLLK